MDSSKSCKISKNQGADKICISQHCYLQNPYVCSSCQQSHQHNGSSLTVRLGKIKQIHQQLNKMQTNISKVTTQMLELKNWINHKIDQFVHNQGQNLGKITELSQSLTTFLQGNGNGKQKFNSVWEKIKANNELFEQKQIKEHEESVSEIKQALIKQISSINMQNQKKQRQKQKNSEFIQRFSDIFCNLNIELKSKNSAIKLQQIKQLETEQKAVLKTVAKLYQLFQYPQQALRIYNSAISQSGLDVQIINRKALLLEKCKKYQQAYDQFSLLIDLVKQKTNPDFYHFHKGQACRHLNKLEEALQQYKKCSRELVNPISLDKSIAYVTWKLGKFKEAVQMYQNLLKNQKLTNQDKLEMFENIYECSKQLKDQGLTIQALNAMIKMKPQDYQLLLKRAKLYHQQKQHANAAKDYTTVLEKVNNVPGLYYNRAVELIYSGQSFQAIPDLKKAIQLDPNFKEAVHLLAHTSFQLLQKQQIPQVAEHLKILAINTYDYCLKFYPKSQGIWHNLGILETQKNPKKAYDCFCKAIQINPKLAASYLGKIKSGILLHKDPKQTMKDLGILIDLGDRTVSTFLIKCAIQQQLGLYNQASETVKLVLKADPENKHALEISKRLSVILNQLKKEGIEVKGQQPKKEQSAKQTQTNN